MGQVREFGQFGRVEVIGFRHEVIIVEDRVGDGVAPVALSHHRTCGSAYGGSLNTLEASLGVQQRNQPEYVKEAFWIGRVHVARSGVPPRTASVACRFPCSRFIQASL